MDAPLLIALPHAWHREYPGLPVETAWACDRALILGWSHPCSLIWIFLLRPRPSWLCLPKDHPALAILKAEAPLHSSKAWSPRIKGARLAGIEGDPRERWVRLHFHRKKTGGDRERSQFRVDRLAALEAADKQDDKERGLFVPPDPRMECEQSPHSMPEGLNAYRETIRLAFQAIPGRAGICLEGGGENLGLGMPFPLDPPHPPFDAPAYARWRTRFGSDLNSALQGEIPEILEGEGSLVSRFVRQSKIWAEDLLVAPARAKTERLHQKQSQRMSRLESALLKDLDRHRQASEKRIQAELVVAELYRLKGQRNRIELQEGKFLDLPLGLTAEQAAQRWFRDARRGERGIEQVHQLLNHLKKQQETQALPQQELPCPSLQTITHPSAKSPSQAKGRKERHMDEHKGIRKFEAGGFEIWIGKTDEDNDRLSLRLADPWDFWLHVGGGLPGSHVVIRNPEKLSELPKAVLQRAAELAAFHSKARNAGKTEVHLCRASDVSKPKGFPPGKVLLKRFQSLRVYPAAGGDN